MTVSPENGRRDLPRLHVVTNDAVLADPRFPERTAALLRLGGARIALHLRGHRTSGRAMMENAEQCVAAARESGAMVLINDRVDVALASGADGVQLGSRSLSVSETRGLLGARRSIGVSIHSAAEAEQAIARGADFLVAGTLYSSASHPGRPAAGVAWLHDVTRLGRPIIGIGGIDPSRVREVLDAGAHGVAVIRGIWGAESIEAGLAAYLELL